MTVFWGVAALAVAVLLVMQSRSRSRSVVADRAALFELCTRTDDVTTGGTANGYPWLVVRRGGENIRVGVVPTSLGFRCLPQLWLTAGMTLSASVPCRLSLVARPTAAETWSRHDECPVVVRPAGPDCPVDVRASDVVSPQWASRLLPFFDDPRLKQLDVSPTQVRLVWRGADADRATYRVTRVADFTGARITEAQLSGLLDAVTRVGTVVRDGRRADASG